MLHNLLLNLALRYAIHGGGGVHLWSIIFVIQPRVFLILVNWVDTWNFPIWIVWFLGQVINAILFNLCRIVEEKYTPVLLPGKSHGRRSLVGCSPWGHQESDTTERLPFHFPLWCIGEGNGNPLQCSCLENPRDGGAWWAAVYGVAQSRTRLKRLSGSRSSSSSSSIEE